MFLEFSILNGDMRFKVAYIPHKYYRPQSNKKIFTLPRKDGVKII